MQIPSQKRNFSTGWRLAAIHAGKWIGLHEHSFSAIPCGHMNSRLPSRDPVGDFAERESSIPQYSAEYTEIDIIKGDIVVRFQGQRENSLLSLSLDGGRCWWIPGIVQTFAPRRFSDLPVRCTQAPIPASRLQSGSTSCAAPCGSIGAHANI